MEGASGAAAATDTQVKPTPGKIVSSGVPTKMEIELRNIPITEEGAGVEPQETEEEKTAREKLELDAKNKPPELTQEQKNAVLAEQLGIKDFDGNVETIKAKLNAQPAAADPTPEEKLKAEAAFEKRMLDFYVDNGGKVEEFMALKTIASQDLTELSVAEIKREMKEKGFDDDEIKVVLKERYYQLNPEEITQEAAETDDDFAKRKKQIEKKIAYGKEKITSRGAKLKEQAKSIYDGLKNAVTSKDAEAQEEVKLSSKVDEVVSALPRTLTFELGKVNNQDISPVEYKVTDAEVAEIADQLKDPAKRKQLLYTSDGSLNLSGLSNLLLRNKILETAIKASLLEGGNRQVAIFEKTFPGRSAFDVGLGKNADAKNGRPGVIASKGEPQRMTVRANP